MTSTALELPPPPLSTLTPKQIVSELDRHVVGQGQAKRAVAIALRNRWRRQQLPPELADEVLPKNILMIGPTGVGKTEIARRLAKLVQAPFHKIEATKFTEVGYVGRDVDSIIRDLMEMAVATVQSEMKERVREEAYDRAEERLLQLLVPPPTPVPGASPAASDGEAAGASTPAPNLARTREKFRDKLRAGELDDRVVEIEVEDTSPRSFEMFTPQGVEEVGFNLKEIMPGLFGRRQRQEVRVSEAREILQQEEAEKLVERRVAIEEARQRVEQSGIVFLDEMDKICVREASRGADVSREGVQRDLLPIVEGTTVNTKYGMVKTDHILFIGAGAFHSSKPSDMIPELQGRFPIRVELNALTEADFVRILTEPESALTKQYVQLLSTEKVDIEFTDDAVAEMARIAVVVNSTTENIGARRLATLVEKVLEEVSFEAPDMAGVHLRIDKSYVEKALGDIVKDEDLSRYVL